MVERIEKEGVIISAIIVLVSLFLGSPFSAVSAALGAVFSIANFWLIARITARLIRHGRQGWKGAVFSVLLKMVLIILILWIMVVHVKLEPVPFAIGLTSVVLAVGFEAVMGLKMRNEAVSVAQSCNLRRDVE